jgi:hypothetical protein
MRLTSSAITVGVNTAARIRFTSSTCRSGLHTASSERRVRLHQLREVRTVERAPSSWKARVTHTWRSLHVADLRTACT